VSVRRVPYEAEGWGAGELIFEDGLLACHDVPHGVFADDGATADHSLAGRIVAYFGGTRDSFADVELDLDWCTEFQRSALNAMREIAYGETATYGEIAALAGHMNAQRAVGSVCAGNRFGIVVPCHRVVAADGIGSYGSLGVGYKRRLLELEGVAV
jgi:methylated-DNA-[protein]-cysteine S-methyltransferase